MAVMFFLQRPRPSEEKNRFMGLRYEPRIRDSVYGSALFPLPDAIVCFVEDVEIREDVAQSSYSPVIAFTAVLRSAKTDWTQPDCPGRNHYWYKIDEVSEVQLNRCIG